MAATTVGSRIVIRAPGGPVVLRALRAVELEGGWVIPVMGDLAALENCGSDAEPVQAEITSVDGIIRLDAEIVHAGPILALRAPGLRTAAVSEQRRENVRAAIALTVRGTVLSPGNGPGESPAGDPRGDSGRPAGGPASRPARVRPREELEGTTRTVSAGGLAVVFGDLPPSAQSGARLYLELNLPGGDLAPAVASMVERHPVKGGVLARLRFIDISPLDSERLVRMVFARHRADLADRRGETRNPS